ncbi:MULTISPECIES: GNAT family N-acetyltransferase [Staphylococcus]|uniref:GNAT family N-acetyltransferase n=1 Tax=Staphylococcus hsinchuensis TaxID=3051183 RepID=A0ABZ3EDY9_9STAP|nr:MULTISPECIES: GNAT family N-acetyltransferase [unclassified Staphylococcus]
MAEIKFSAPNVAEYCHLRKIAGLSEKSETAAKNGLGNACFDVTLYEDDKLIGMGRVIGDGGTAFQIIDIAVDPHYQGMGHGKAIMQHIMEYIETVAVSGTYVSLIADYPADTLYKQFGFISTEPKSTGMYLHYK